MSDKICDSELFLLFNLFLKDEGRYIQGIETRFKHLDWLNSGYFSTSKVQKSKKTKNR